eukprot:3141166-Amphidinium_carterae.1
MATRCMAFGSQAEVSFRSVKRAAPATLAEAPLRMVRPRTVPGVSIKHAAPVTPVVPSAPAAPQEAVALPQPVRVLRRVPSKTPDPRQLDELPSASASSSGSDLDMACRMVRGLSDKPA